MLNASQRGVNKNSLTWWYVLKKSWRYLWKTSWRCLEDALKTDVLKTSSKRLEDALKMSLRRFCNTSWRRLENVLETDKTSWKCLEEVWPRRIYWSWPRRLEDVFWRRKSEANIFLLIKTSWRRLEDLLWRRRRKTSKTSSRRLHQDKCFLGCGLLSLHNYCLILTLNDSNIGFLLIGEAVFLVTRTQWETVYPM